MRAKVRTAWGRVFRAAAFISFALLLFVPPAGAQRLLEADGHTDTFTLINSVLAPGRDAIEDPGCLHPEFGPHITQAYDDALGKPVFVFHMHRDIDGDTCERIDRQRNEIKTYGPSPDYVKGFLNDTVTFRWRFKLDAGFQPSSSFTHIHQIKAGDGDAGAPIITLTPRAGTPQRMELIHVNSLGTTTRLTFVPLDSFKGEWVEVYERFTYSFTGAYSIQIKRLRDGLALLDYSNPSLDLWRTGTTFSRPKWGIYRSLNNIASLRDEQVRFDRFCLAKGADDCVPEAPGFYVSAAPLSRTVSAGNSVAWTVTARPVGGFSETVDLSATGLPPDTTATFEPSSLVGAVGTASLVVTTGSGTPADTYTVGIVGTSASLTRTTAATLVVKDPNVNYPPTISSIADRLIAMNGTTGAIPFAVDDWETPAAALTVSAASSDEAVVPAGGVVLGGVGAARVVGVTPAPDAVGVATITLTVSDGVNAVSEDFVVTVNAPPTISSIPDQTIGTSSTTGPIPFTVADRESPPEGLTVSAASSNTSLVPSAGLLLGGSGSERTLAVTPASGRAGSATITLTVSDGRHGASTSFRVTIDAAPLLSPVRDRAIPEDTSTGAIAFSVVDPETPADAFTVSATSSDPGIVPDENITVVTTPNPWTSTDVGAVAAVGRSAPGDVVVVQASGADIWGTADEGHFVYQPLTGDGEMVARVASLQNTNAWAKAGVMFRASTAANSQQVFMLVSPTSGISLQRRLATGGSSSSTTITGVAAPCWVRLVKSGTTFTASYALDQDGVPAAWLPLGAPLTIDMGPTVLRGLAATSHADGTLATATFDNVSGPPNVGGNRALSVTPAPDANGVTTIHLAVSDGLNSVSRDFDLTVSPVNDPPTLSPTADQALLEDASTGPIPFTVEDVDNPSGDLVVTATAADAALLPPDGIVLGGSGSARIVTLTPAANANGATLVTLTVGDGLSSVSGTFTLAVAAVNDPPTVLPLADRAIPENSSTGPLAFTVADLDNPVELLGVTASSSNPVLVPPAGIALGGSGAERTITITAAPHRIGDATITVTVSDGSATASGSFVLHVEGVPWMSPLPNRTLLEDTSTGPMPFVVFDRDTPIDALALSTSSSNPALVPPEGIAILGDGFLRWIGVQPAANQSGTATITLTATDGVGTASRSFTLTVLAVNDPPTITRIADQEVAEDGTTGAIPFAVGDVETPAAALVVEASSSNRRLLPDTGIVLGGGGASRTITLTPAAGRHGWARVTVTVSDGARRQRTDFRLTVTAAERDRAREGPGTPDPTGEAQP